MSQEDKVKTVVKALRLLEAIGGSDESLTNTEIADKVGINSSTCYRLLKTLHQENYVNKRESTYRLGYKAFQLRGLSREAERIKRVMEPFLARLEQQFGHTVTLAVRRGTRAIPVAIIKGTDELTVNQNLGQPVPLHASALGKCFLSFSRKEVQDLLLEQITLDSFTQNTITEKSRILDEMDCVFKRGYAVDNQEFTDSVVCVGIPIYDDLEVPIYAISVSGPASRINVENEENIRLLVNALERTRENFSKEYLIGN